MAGRNRVPAHVLHLRDQPPPAALIGRPPPGVLLEDPHLHRLPLIPHPHPAIIALEDRLGAQIREIQALLVDNQRLAATHVALKQELTAAQHNLRLAASDAAKVRDERDGEVRALYERSAKAEAEVFAIDGMRGELSQVQSDVQKLRAARDELVERLRGAREELERTRAEIAQAPDMRAEIEAMHREIQKGRAAVEYEKKAHASNMEQSQAMETNMVSLAREVEKLRAELGNAEKRARAAAAAAPTNPGYNIGSYGNSEMAYGGAAYGDSYSMQQVQRSAEGGTQYGARVAEGGTQYGARVAEGGSQYGSRIAQSGPQYGSRGAEGVPQYGSAVPRGPYDMQQAHAHR